MRALLLSLDVGGQPLAPAGSMDHLPPLPHGHSAPSMHGAGGTPIGSTGGASSLLSPRGTLSGGAHAHAHSDRCSSSTDAGNSAPLSAAPPSAGAAAYTEPSAHYSSEALRPRTGRFPSRLALLAQATTPTPSSSCGGAASTANLDIIRLQLRSTTGGEGPELAAAALRASGAASPEGTEGDTFSRRGTANGDLMRIGEAPWSASLPLLSPRVVGSLGQTPALRFTAAAPARPSAMGREFGGVVGGGEGGSGLQELEGGRDASVPTWAQSSLFASSVARPVGAQQ
ncbi:hypothetical protein GPECTOR_64g94 [Gonium pectorale]|uniref:Uncharacterized protein n=1 Tax=Gonium pectorale TaxID=33097 RepID=A0A150G4C3_GONPE|nr:hypothetical protein GPECTOR_64g94 [Gonium pectorale]|eukprot:KXZ44674.1 hypothetical protein GPECTOR_64g94 [Gonium pectorale]